MNIKKTFVRNVEHFTEQVLHSCHMAILFHSYRNIANHYYLHFFLSKTMTELQQRINASKFIYQSYTHYYPDKVRIKINLCY